MLLLPRLWRPETTSVIVQGDAVKVTPLMITCVSLLPGNKTNHWWQHWNRRGKVAGTLFTVACITHHKGIQAFRVENTHNVVLVPSVQIQSAWLWSLPSSLLALDSIPDHSQVPCWLSHFTYFFPKASVFGMFGQDRRHCFPLWLTISIIKTFDTYFWKPLRK